MMIYYLYIDSYMFRSYDHHQAEKVHTEEKTSPITAEYQNDTQHNIGNYCNVRSYETMDPLAIE
jgi:hypothetical protein